MAARTQTGRYRYRVIFTLPDGSEGDRFHASKEAAIAEGLAFPWDQRRAVRAKVVHRLTRRTVWSAERTDWAGAPAGGLA